MGAVASESVEARLRRVRAHMRSAGIDTLVVTHLPNIRYLTGFCGSAGALVLLPSACRLIVDFRYVAAATALIGDLAPGLVTLEAVERSYDETLLAVLLREGSLRAGVEGAYLSVSRFNAVASRLAAIAQAPLSEADPCATLVATERIVERARVVKDADEITALREGARRLSAIARRLPEFARAGRSERAVAHDIDEAMRVSGFSRPAFETMVASGPNSVLPHARPTDRVPVAGDPTVLDFGGVYDGYCVDLTRTVQVGAPSPALRQLYEAVAEAQRAAFAAVRPGVPPSEIDAAARRVLEARGLGAAFGHGTGHGLGLEVHEDPRIARHAPGIPDDPVEPGMVFTIEPGAYVAGVGGVRIEDDVLVTAEGCEVLTDAPALFDT